MQNLESKSEPVEGLPIADYKLQMSEQKGGETARVLPLYLRRFGLDEIALITGFELSSIHNVLNYLRRDGVLRRPSQPESNIARVQTGRLRGLFAGEEMYTMHQENSFTFTSSLLKAKLFSVDLSNWYALHSFYDQFDRRLPVATPDKLRLEVFYQAIRDNDTQTINLMQRFGEIADDFWFNNGSIAAEEDFVAANLKGNVIYGKADEIGYYVEDDKGNRWRPLSLEDNFLFENFQLALQRQQARERNSQANQ